MSFTQSVLEWIINNLLTDSQLSVHVFGCKYPLREWVDKDKFRKDQEILEAKLALADAGLEMERLTDAAVWEKEDAPWIKLLGDASTAHYEAAKKLKALLSSA